MSQARGSISKWKTDPERWRVRVTVGTEPITGKERRLSKVVEAPHNRTGRRVAEEALAELIAQATAMRRSTQRVPHGMTVKELADRWVRSKRTTWEPKTEMVHQGVLDRNIIPTIGSVVVAELTHELLEEMYARFASTPRTARQIHSTMHTMLTQTVRWRAIPFNPASAAEAPSYQSPEIDPPEPEVVKRAMALCDEDHPDFALYLRLAATMGSRRSEICGLQWRDFDLEAGTVWVRRSIAKDPAGQWAPAPTKTKSRHRVAIGPSAVENVRAARARADANAELAGVTIREDSYVFSPATDRREVPRPDSFTQRWSGRKRKGTEEYTGLRVKLGLDGVRIHDLRHYVVIQLIAQGVDIVTVSGRLAHRRRSTTLDMYAAFLPEKDREAADLLDA